jgi:hypothetical protein
VRLDVTLTVQHPTPGPNTKLPLIWTAPLKLEEHNGTTQLRVSGPTKLGSTCGSPAYHVLTALSLVDTCNLAQELGLSVAVGASADTCVAQLKAHAAVLPSPGASFELPLEMQFPPLLQPWPPRPVSRAVCASDEARSHRNPAECISCKWGSVTANRTGEALCHAQQHAGARPCCTCVWRYPHRPWMDQMPRPAACIVACCCRCQMHATRTEELPRGTLQSHGYVLRSPPGAAARAPIEAGVAAEVGECESRGGWC